MAGASGNFSLFVAASGACIPQGSGFSSGYISTYYAVDGEQLLSGMVHEEFSQVATSYSYCTQSCCHTSCGWWSCSTSCYCCSTATGYTDTFYITSSATPPSATLTHLALGADDCFWYQPNN